MNKRLIFGIVGFVLVVFILGSVFSQDVYAKIDGRGAAFSSKTINDNLCEVADCSSGRISGITLFEVSNIYPVGTSVYSIMKKRQEIKSSGIEMVDDFVFLPNLKAESFNFVATSLFEIGEYVRDVDFNWSIKVARVDVSKVSGVTRIGFSRANGDLIVGNNSFSNIVPENDSYVTLDSLGQVVSASFLTGRSSQDYVFGNTKVFVPAGSYVQYLEGIIAIDAPDNATFDRLPSIFDLDGYFSETTIEGKNILLPNGRTLDSGAINFRAGEFYVKPGESAVIDGVRVTGEDKTSIFFDGKEHSGDYVSLGKEKIVMVTSKNKNLALNFEDGNEYFKNPVSVGLKKKNSLLTVSKIGQFEDLPEVRSSSEFEVKSGELYFDKIANERVYLYSEESDTQSSKMTIVSGNSKIISVGDKNNFYAHLTGTSNPDVRRINYFRNELTNNPEVRDELYSATSYFGKQTYKQGVYLKGAQKILLEKLIDKNPEIGKEVDSFNALTNSELLEKSAKSSLNKYYLTPEEIEKALTGTPYVDYWKVLDAHRDLHISFKTKGSVEKAKDVSQENFGLRQAFFKY